MQRSVWLATCATNLRFKPAHSADGRKAGSAQSAKPLGPSLLTLIDPVFVPLAVDLCYWLAESTNSPTEIDQFVPALQDGIILCRLVNVMNKLKCDKNGEHFKLVHFRENIGNSIFFARINVETFIRWSKEFGCDEDATCTVSDLVDAKDIGQALSNVHAVGRRCAELGLPYPGTVAMEVEHEMSYNEIVQLFDPAKGPLNKDEKAAKDALVKLINHRGLGLMKCDATINEQLGIWKKKIAGKWAGTDTPNVQPELVIPPPKPAPEPEPKPEPKMGPWEHDEIVHLIHLYSEQIQEYGDDHIDFQGLSKTYTKCFQHRTPHQCWDKMYQLIERYHCDRSANRLFKRKVCSGPHHDELHICLGDTDLRKHLNAVYTGMLHPKCPAVPAYIDANPQERADDEKTGRAQLAEQTDLLRNISEQLKAIRIQSEQSATTNSALLVLLTHVLKGEPTEQSVAPPPAPLDIAKSLGSDADLVENDKLDE